MQNLTPQDAVTALFGKKDPQLAEAIVASLSRAVFENNGEGLKPAGRFHRLLSRVSYRVLQWTTQCGKHEDEAGAKVMVFTNRILEFSGHPFAKSLLGSTKREAASLIEGGDPMNTNYMMIAPEIRTNRGLWDRLLLDTVQGKDVRLRLVWETKATYEVARQRLLNNQPVRLKAVAAGTGLSMILVYDRLVREGFDANMISVLITDLDEANIAQTNQLLAKLDTTKGQFRRPNGHGGIFGEAQDIFTSSSAAGSPHETYDVVTAIGILEYFQGYSYGTTEERLKLETPKEPASAYDLAVILDNCTAKDASLIVNTYRADASIRILELFGRRFDYRKRANLRSLLEAANFKPTQLVGSGNIYDVEVYQKGGRLS